jgi:hypothetical protein
VQPQSADLKNLLLQVNPEKWTDRIRTVAPAPREQKDDDDLDDPKPNAKSRMMKRREESQKTSAEGNWFSKLASTAGEAVMDGLKAVAHAKETAEQRAKAAAEKERKRKERRERKEREAAEKEAKIKAAAAMGILLTADGKVWRVNLNKCLEVVTISDYRYANETLPSMVLPNLRSQL